MANPQVQDGPVDADGLSEAGQGARNARQNTLASFPALGPPDLVYTVKRYRGLVGAPTYAVRFLGGGGCIGSFLCARGGVVAWLHLDEGVGGCLRGPMGICGTARDL